MSHAKRGDTIVPFENATRAFSGDGESETEGFQDAGNRCKFGVSFRRLRLVEIGAAEAGGLSDFRHALGAGDVAERCFQEVRVAVLEHGVEIGRDVSPGLQGISCVPTAGLARHINLHRQFERAGNVAALASFVPAAKQNDAAATIKGVDHVGFRLHRLKGDYKGLWAVTVRANWRIVFRFEDGAARDIDLIDYH